MQEDKLKNLSQAEALVPLDTDGEEVEIELEGVASETEAVAEVEEVVEETNDEEPKAEDTEHEEYSKGVQKRIDKLTAKLREAERREQLSKYWNPIFSTPHTPPKNLSDRILSQFIHPIDFPAFTPPLLHQIERMLLFATDSGTGRDGIPYSAYRLLDLL